MWTRTRLCNKPCMLVNIVALIDDLNKSISNHSGFSLKRFSSLALNLSGSSDSPLFGFRFSTMPPHDFLETFSSTLIHYTLDRVVSFYGSDEDEWEDIEISPNQMSWKDGDSFTINRGGNITEYRVYGIDAPEISSVVQCVKSLLKKLMKTQMSTLKEKFIYQYIQV